MTEVKNDNDFRPRRHEVVDKRHQPRTAERHACARTTRPGARKKGVPAAGVREKGRAALEEFLQKFAGRPSFLA